MGGAVALVIVVAVLIIFAPVLSETMTNGVMEFLDNFVSIGSHTNRDGLQNSQTAEYNKLYAFKQNLTTDELEGLYLLGSKNYEKDYNSNGIIDERLCTLLDGDNTVIELYSSNEGPLVLRYDRYCSASMIEVEYYTADAAEFYSECWGRDIPEGWIYYNFINDQLEEASICLPFALSIDDTVENIEVFDTLIDFSNDVSSWVDAGDLKVKEIFTKEEFFTLLNMVWDNPDGSALRSGFTEDENGNELCQLFLVDIEGQKWVYNHNFDDMEPDGIDLDEPGWVSYDDLLTRPADGTALRFDYNSIPHNLYREEYAFFLDNVCPFKHNFTIMNASPKFLVSLGVCSETSKYNYSCRCGAVGAEIFEISGEHDFINYICLRCGMEYDGLFNEGVNTSIDELKALGYLSPNAAIVSGFDTFLTGIYVVPSYVAEIPDNMLLNCTEITGLYFNGTVSEWASISKGYNWDYNVGFHKVICIDGEVCLHYFEGRTCNYCDALAEPGLYQKGKMVKSWNELFELGWLKRSYVYTTNVRASLQTRDNLIGDLVFPNDSGIMLESLEECQYLTSVTLPDKWDDAPHGVLEYAFSRCTALKRVNIPEGVSYLMQDAFSHCYNLESVILPSTITGFGTRCFYSCGSLNDITLPALVNFFGPNSFGQCGTLKIKYLGTIEEWSDGSFQSSWASETSITVECLDGTLTLSTTQ